MLEKGREIKEPVIDDDYDDEDGDKDEYEKEAKAREGVKDKKENLIKFVKIDGPSGHSEFLETRKVALEQVRYEDKKRVIQGEIKVLNIQFEKNVTVRYTLDAWRSSSDINAEFTKVEQKSTQNFPGVDLFTFKIDTGVICQSAIDKLCCVEIEMCVRYKAGNMEYWDNNNGRNYSFKITALSSGLDSSNGLCVRKVDTKATASKLSEILRGKAELPPINKNIGILTAPKSLSFAQPQNDDIRIRLVQYRTPGSDAHVQNTFASHASHRPSSSVSNYPFSWDSYYKKASYTQHPRSNSNSPPAGINYSSTPRRMASQSYGPMGMGSEIIRCGSPSVLGSSPILTFSNIYSTTPLAGSPQTSRPGSPVVISRSSSTESMLAWVDGEPYSSSPLHEMPKLIC
ncbi:Protein phosphatase 1 regulatory subunit 3C [Zancudomyces culisetae]|uniref:Protein phosphatase 1 regulatory subunit 3C n=1 Tax=Zancudomyces culisetae TaxID=1213189 RepID=A0A1R1PVS9_ZANCU|nr:Protein phosphatase 1 regulatory subunit 3C [Zancudomyces culisetae]|eukprot:OMH85071.1 Protein phosphatase 1 regulatory subunit 3C [Zancudomyces culisetae]